ncbi:MAG: sulfatase-like hydrolase/transferase [Planctomycetota bacterium]|jgi:choline-sulfatase
MLTLRRCCLALLCTTLALAAAEGATKPNIVILCADDWSPMYMGCYNDAHVPTPNVDAIAERGVRFTAGYCQGSVTAGVCISSRTMLWTGRTLIPHAHEEGGQGSSFKIPDINPGDQLKPSLPLVLRGQGYATARFGKGRNWPKHLSVDFDACESAPSGREEAASYADLAISFIREQAAAGKPFFTFVGPLSPHDPQPAPESYYEDFSDAPVPQPASFRYLPAFDYGELSVRDELTRGYPRNWDEVADKIRAYYASLTHLDDQWGRVIAELDALGVRDNTYIVITADHSLALGEHGLLGKQHLFEACMRLPLIISGPGIEPGVHDGSVYLHDLYPTVCTWAGAAIPDCVDSLDLTPALASPEQPLRETAILFYKHFQRAIRKDGWKLIVFPQINRQLLFDLNTDPEETTDLSTDPAQAQRIAELRAQLEHELTAAGDPTPLTSANPKDDSYPDLSTAAGVDAYNAKWGLRYHWTPGKGKGYKNKKK